ncbi:IclR family transcriptional regulator [Mesorhizobium sp. J428]|uniref:IclR family transcriptional regulator n=1 Tax=Mesorhizobium sp. J428 TaxID=2898440 RepID=UPI0021514D40|nr:helix-turn-helix domain-containing protein [Mesorhizobium sp. J428]MCR5858019.1 helix-turn-helix domain-containing protein [Mesorhizobium sp. J428]
MSSLENALKIVSLLDRTRPVLRVGEVCREIGIPKSSVSRLMKTLGDYGILEREAGEGVGYVAGPRSLLLADLYSAQHSLKDQVEVALERLTEEFGFAGYVSVINGADIIILSVRHGSYPLRLVREIGQPMPAFTTSVGRALMSYLEDGEIIRLARVYMGDRYSDEEILARVEMGMEIRRRLGAERHHPGHRRAGGRRLGPAPRRWYRAVHLLSHRRRRPGPAHAHVRTSARGGGRHRAPGTRSDLGGALRRGSTSA